MPAKHSVKAEAAKARVLYCHLPFLHNFDTALVLHSSTTWGKKQPVAVLPFASAKQAREFVKIFNMTNEERATEIANVTMNHDGARNWHAAYRYALKALSALGFPGSGSKEG